VCRGFLRCTCHSVFVVKGSLSLLPCDFRDFECSYSLFLSPLAASCCYVLSCAVLKLFVPFQILAFTPSVNWYLCLCDCCALGIAYVSALVSICCHFSCFEVTCAPSFLYFTPLCFQGGRGCQNDNREHHQKEEKGGDESSGFSVLCAMLFVGTAATRRKPPRRSASRLAAEKILEENRARRAAVKRKSKKREKKKQDVSDSEAPTPSKKAKGATPKAKASRRFVCDLCNACPLSGQRRCQKSTNGWLGMLMIEKRTPVAAPGLVCSSSALI